MMLNIVKARRAFCIHGYDENNPDRGSDNEPCSDTEPLYSCTENLEDDLTGNGTL